MANRKKPAPNPKTKKAIERPAQRPGTEHKTKPNGKKKQRRSNTALTEAERRKRGVVARRRKIARFLNDGFDIPDIAALTGVQIPTILADMRYIETSNATGLARDRSVDDVIEEDLALIDIAIAEAWQAWDISKTQVFFDKDGKKIDVPKDPDPRFLEMAMKARDRRASIYGIKDYEIGKYISAEAMQELMAMVVMCIRTHITEPRMQEAIGKDLQRVVADLLMQQETRLALPTGK